MDSVSPPVIDSVRYWMALVNAGLKQVATFIHDLQDAKVSREIAQRQGNAKAEAAAINRGRHAQNNLATALTALHTWTNCDTLDSMDCLLAEVSGAMDLAIEMRAVWLKGKVMGEVLAQEGLESAEVAASVEVLQRRYANYVESLTSKIPNLREIP